MSDPITRLNAALEGRYRIERELGEGGMATVYLADDLKHERKVALKVLKPELAAVVGAERFLAEIKTTANLQHPHILPLFDSGEADSFLFYVMPYVEGETLRERIDREKQLPVDEALRIATAVAHALHTAHEQGVVHRDIKPANILMSRGEPLVADFGIALAVGAAGGSRLTETGLSLGTPYYMSPEQATGDQQVGPPSDTYALAAMLYEMLTGDPPYIGSTAQAVLGKIIQGVPVSATAVRKSIPANVDAAIRKALEKLPADRFTDAHGFATALEDQAFRHGEDITAAGAAAAGSSRAAAGVGWAVAAAFAGAFARATLAPEDPASVLRYSLMVPDEMAMANVFGPTMGISADGEALVYVAVDGGVPRLWIRERDQLEPRLLDGTEDANQPFFSPDGARVGFVTLSRELKIVSLGGEPPLTVVDSGLVRGGADWSTDGYIYFAEGSSNASVTAGLGRVPAVGGPIESVTMLDTARNELIHHFPEVLPSGRTVLFTVVHDRIYDPETMDIAVGDIETGEYHIILKGLMARWSPTGHILFVRGDGALLAAPFDEDRLEVTGPAVPLIDGISLERLGGSSGLPSSVELILSDNGTLVYRAGGDEDEASGFWSPVWIDRSGAAREIDAGLRRGNFRAPTLSPDGGRLALTLTEAGEAQIWIKQLDLGPMSKVTFQGTANSRAAWAPDGSNVVFGSNRAAGDIDAYVRPADGSGRAELAIDADGDIAEMTYSPDGIWLVYRMLDDLFAQRIGSDDAPVPLATTPFIERNPTVSPDSRWIAYTSDESGTTEVYVRPFPNTGDGRWLVSTGGGISPVWANSGRELFYVTSDLRMMVVPVLEGATFVYEQPQDLFSVSGLRISGAHQFFDVSPDDQSFIAFQGAGGSGRIVVVENWIEELRARLGS